MHLLSKINHMMESGIFMMTLMMRMLMILMMMTLMMMTLMVRMLMRMMMISLIGFGKYQQNGQNRSARSGRDWKPEQRKTYCERTITAFISK